MWRCLRACHSPSPPALIPVLSIVLDMDSQVSPTHGDQEGFAWNGHFDSFNAQAFIYVGQFDNRAQTV